MEKTDEQIIKETILIRARDILNNTTRVLSKDEARKHLIALNFPDDIINIIYKEYENKTEIKDLKIRFLELISGKEKKISKATEILLEYILKHNYIYTTKDDIKSEMWIYKDGIYLPQGRSEIKEIMRNILDEWYNVYYYNQVIAKIEADTFIDADKFFKTNHKYEIPVQNGILNIITKQISKYTPEKIFFNKMPVKYEPTATCAAIDDYLNDVLKNEEDKKLFYELA
jgi:hypothetical protein